MGAGANVDYSEKRTISSLMQNERTIPQESSPRRNTATIMLYEPPDNWG
jgi:hypothetical protein